MANGGGTESSRGFEFQDYSLLLYLLLRKLRYPNIDTVIHYKPNTKEVDARIVYTLKDNNQKIIELVECKKREDKDSEEIHPGVVPSDYYSRGRINASHFKGYIGKELIKELLSNNDVYYTLLIFSDLSQSLENFLPPKYQSLWTPEIFNKNFPIDFMHPSDKIQSLKKESLKNFRNKMGQKIRILPIKESDKQIDHNCRCLLHQYYRVNDDYTNKAVKELKDEIAKHRTPKGEENRHLQGRDIEKIIAKYRVGQGRWQSYDKFLETESTHLSDLNKGESLSWIDFENNRYFHRDEFEEAWETLKHKQDIVVWGKPGSGKTTLCYFLAFQFMKEFPNGLVYYLPVEPVDSFSGEIEFVKQQINTETLFILDDEYLSHEEVEEIVENFMKSVDIGEGRARLLVTSTRRYGKTQAMSQRALLHKFDSIQLSSNKEVSRGIISFLKEQGGLTTSLTSEELVSLSWSNIGYAVIIARCAKDYEKSLSAKRLLTSKNLVQTLEEWIIKHLQRNEHHRSEISFSDEVAPVFIVVGYDLPVPENFSKIVLPLYHAGFLSPLQENSLTEKTTYKAVNLRLAEAVSGNYESLRLQVVSNYVKEYPGFFPLVFEQLRRLDERTLRDLYEKKSDLVIKTINDNEEINNIRGVTKILRNLYKCDRKMGRDLLDKLTYPYGEAYKRFFQSMIERTTNTSALSDFFETVHNINRYSMRSLAQQDEGLHNEEFELIHNCFGAASLDEIAVCLRAVRRLHRDFAYSLYKKTKRGLLLTKISETEENPRKLSIWLHFCKNLKIIDRADCYDYLKKYLSFERIEPVIRHAPEIISHISQFLHRLRRVDPRQASNIILKLWEQNQTLLIESLEKEDALDSFCNDLYSLSRLNKRIAVDIANKSKAHLCSLVEKERHYHKIGGSAIDSLKKNISINLAGDVVKHMDYDTILQSAMKEDKRVDLVGKFLYSLSIVYRDMGGRFASKIDYSSYLRKITKWRLRNATHLVRGFLAASSNPEEKLLEFKNDNVLKETFNKGWDEAEHLSEIGLCLCLLLEIPLVKEGDIITLLKFSNKAELEAKLLKKFKQPDDIIHIANVLLGVAKFDIHMAKEILEEYVEHDKEEVSQIKANLIDISCLLQAASAVDISLARRLAEKINLKRFYAQAKEENNLGRIAVFLTGLYRVSRKFSLQFLNEVSPEQKWKEQFEENEEITNVIHYALALSHISKSLGKQYIKFIFENYEEEIRDILEIESNLMLISNWLRVLSMAGDELASKHMGSISNFISSATVYDTRLRHLLETTEGLIECDNSEFAREFANKSLEEASQIQAIQRLYDWIVLFHKALHIGRELQIPDFLPRLMRNLENWKFALLLNNESQPILRAYTCYLLKTLNVSEMESFQKIADQSQKSLVNHYLMKDKFDKIDILSLIFTKTNMENFEILDWHQPRERGLTSILFKTVFESESSPFDCPHDLDILEWQKKLTDELKNEHISNLEYGLILHLCPHAGLKQTQIQQFQKKAEARAEDESNSTICWLLLQQPGEVNLQKLPYYLWAYLKEAILRPTDMAWESNIDAIMDNIVFGKNYKPDIAAISF